MYEVSKSRKHGYALPYQLEKLCYMDTAINCSLQTVDSVTQGTLDCSDLMELSSSYVANVEFEGVHNLLKDGKVFSLKEEEELADWLEVIKCNARKGSRPLILKKVPSSRAEMLGVKRTQASTRKVVQLDEEKPL